MGGKHTAMQVRNVSSEDAAALSPAQMLAHAIIVEACRDYRSSSSRSKRNSIERFFRSEWFGCLTSIDPEALIKRLQEECR